MVNEILNKVKELVSANTVISTFGIPVALFDYDDLTAYQEDINKIGLCVTIRLLDIDRVIYQSWSCIGYNYTLLIDVFEQKLEDNLPINGQQLAEQVMGTLQNKEIGIVGVERLVPQSLKNSPNNFKVNSNESIVKHFICTFNMNVYMFPKD